LVSRHSVSIFSDHPIELRGGIFNEESVEEFALRKIQRANSTLSDLPVFPSVFPQRLPTAGRLKKCFDASGIFTKLLLQKH